MSVKERTEVTRTCDECGSNRTEYLGAAREAGINTWTKLELLCERFDFCDDDCASGKVAATVKRLGGS